jgi:hypothetical protein
MKSEINAIKSLIKSRNKGYNSELLELNVTEEELSWSKGTTWLTVTGFEASAYFAQMKPFLAPMICDVDIVTAKEVKLIFRKRAWSK